MSCLQQDGTGDLLLTRSNGAARITLVTDRSACAAQKLTNRFLLFLGEWFLDTRIGLRYLQMLSVKNPDLRAIRQYFAKVVLSVPPVVKIDQLDLKLTSRRQLQMSLHAKTDNGQTIVGGPGNAFVIL